MNQLGSRDEAEDAVQSTFLNAHRALQRGVTPEAELAWLFKIAHNVCLTRRRSTSRRGRVEAATDLDAMQDYVPAPARESADELIRLTDALAHMPDNQRRAILLREWQGLSYREIADELDLSQSAVETLIFRARRSLAANLETAQESDAPLLKRVRQALDVGGLLAALKGLLSAGAAVKAAATAVAVTGAAVVATSPGEPANRAPAPVEPTPSVAFEHERVVVDRGVSLARVDGVRDSRASVRASRPASPGAKPAVARPETSAQTAAPVPSDAQLTGVEDAPAVAEKPKQDRAPGPPEHSAAAASEEPKKEPKAEHAQPVQQLAPPANGNADKPKEAKQPDPGPPAGVVPGLPPESPGNSENAGNDEHGNAGGNGAGRDK